MVAVHRRARSQPGPGMRLAVWATRLLALNFVLVLALNASGAVYAATLTTVTLFAVAATLSVLRYRTVEVDLVLRRAFVVVGVAGASLIAFLTTFVVVELVVGPSVGAVAAAAAVAVLAVPVRSGVQRRVDRMLYGHRDAADAIAQASSELNAADTPGSALPGLARALTEALAASAVVIEPEPSGWGSRPAATGMSSSSPFSSATCAFAASRSAACSSVPAPPASGTGRRI